MTAKKTTPKKSDSTETLVATGPTIRAKTNPGRQINYGSQRFFADSEGWVEVPADMQDSLSTSDYELYPTKPTTLGKKGE